jgi:hypothetical protein
MRLIYSQGFSKSEKEEWRAIIFNNILSAFKVILDAMEELGIEFGNKDNDVSAILECKTAFSTPHFKCLLLPYISVDLTK